MVSHVYIVVLQNKRTGQYALRACATRVMAEAIEEDMVRILPNPHHYELATVKSKLERMPR